LSRRLRRLVLLLAVCLGPAACADALSPMADGMTWRHFLGAEDVKLFCTDGAPDRYRMIFHDRTAPDRTTAPRLRLIEVLEDQADGGALVRGRVLTPADMAQTKAGDDYSDWLGAFASYRLTPLQFATLAHRLENSGAFETPEFGRGRPPNAAKALVGGCRAGAWFFNAFEDPTAAGELI
jgi:hypothetical protein